MLLHDSHSDYYRSPCTPVHTGQTIRFRLRYDGKDKVYLRTWNGKERLYPMQQVEKDVYECSITAPDKVCQLWYCFRIDESFRPIHYGNNEKLLGGEGAAYTDHFHSYLIVVYDKSFCTPSYLREGNTYQIFPDRFRIGNYVPKEQIDDRILREWHEDPILQVDCKNGDNFAHDFFMGNLRGIVEKLDYLYDLGIRTLYLNPIFRAATNHRYDTGDYTQIDPYLGDEAEFTLLCEELKKRDMHLILDGVFSHTGNDSLYFNQKGRYPGLGAAQSKDSPYYEWYTFQSYPSKYSAWWGIYTLPEINKNAKSYRQYLFNKEDGIAHKWLRLGASAWRLDVADELPMDFLSELRTNVKDTHPDAVLIGEVWEDASNKIAYEQTRCYCLGDTLDSVMNYPLRTAIIQFLLGNAAAGDLAQLILHQREVYPAPFLYSLMNLVGSHDRARILNVFAMEEHQSEDRSYTKHVKLTQEQYTAAYGKYLQAIALLTALPGTPTIYYGDEAGMQGTADPWNRRTYPWGYEDKSLVAAVKALLNNRLEHKILQTGLIDVKVINDDCLEIKRFAENGRDAFGDTATNETITLRLNRNDEGVEWIYEQEYDELSY